MLEVNARVIWRTAVAFTVEQAATSTANRRTPRGATGAGDHCRPTR
ncbi:hypothetical protein ACGF7U_14305 [Micromonospora sp. NPDC047670]